MDRFIKGRLKKQLGKEQEREITVAEQFGKLEVD
ncbi:hypothetical protein COLO4_15146 [Corchorus olitorius]|uniref:Uncharacterized protein n=1 Tax=Corchorus olitorius TaxID=93759 RepID=A0A1R3JP78_9ROSI|nr:hypothetical protein COLO4_15146 [Corchorus olitorius]